MGARRQACGEELGIARAAHVVEVIEAAPGDRRARWRRIGDARARDPRHAIDEGLVLEDRSPRSRAWIERDRDRRVIPDAVRRARPGGRPDREGLDRVRGGRDRPERGRERSCSTGRERGRGTGSLLTVARVVIGHDIGLALDEPGVRDEQVVVERHGMRGKRDRCRRCARSDERDLRRVVGQVAVVRAPWPPVDAGQVRRHRRAISRREVTGPARRRAAGIGDRRRCAERRTQGQAETHDGHLCTRGAESRSSRFAGFGRPSSGVGANSGHGCLTRGRRPDPRAAAASPRRCLHRDRARPRRSARAAGARGSRAS